jgi:O-methyltransferase
MEVLSGFRVCRRTERGLVLAATSDADVSAQRRHDYDWDHDRAVAILRNCRRAMNQTGRLLLIESVIAGPDEPDPGKIMDFIMLLGLGGQERTEQQFADLLREAGFTLTRVVRTASPMSVIEAMPT